jgi:hypothetical protein
MTEFVCVVWVDAENHSGWTDVKEAGQVELPVVYTTGWIVSSNNSSVVAVAQSVGPKLLEEDVGGVWYIPRGMIKQIVKLHSHPLLPTSAETILDMETFFGA